VGRLHLGDAEDVSEGAKIMSRRGVLHFHEKIYDGPLCHAMGPDLKPRGSKRTTSNIRKVTCLRCLRLEYRAAEKARHRSFKRNADDLTYWYRVWGRLEEVRAERGAKGAGSG
jgi:hypothetical protein